MFSLKLRRWNFRFLKIQDDQYNKKILTILFLRKQILMFFSFSRENQCFIYFTFRFYLYQSIEFTSNATQWVNCQSAWNAVSLIDDTWKWIDHINTVQWKHRATNCKHKWRQISINIHVDVRNVTQWARLFIFVSFHLQLAMSRDHLLVNAWLRKFNVEKKMNIMSSSLFEEYKWNFLSKICFSVSSIKWKTMIIYLMIQKRQIVTIVKKKIF